MALSSIDVPKTPKSDSALRTAPPSIRVLAVCRCAVSAAAKSSKTFRAESAISRCSSVMKLNMLCPVLASMRHIEEPLGDDVLLNLGRARKDGFSTGVKVNRHEALAVHAVRRGKPVVHAEHIG